MSKSRAPFVLIKPGPLMDLSDRAAGLLKEMLDAYQTRRVGALRHNRKSVDRDVAIISNFLSFSGQPPWAWTEEAFEQWCEHLGLERRLAPASQRHYQSAIRNFLAYLTENVKFLNEVRRLFNVDLVQICHRENCIPHVSDSEMRVERRAMTHEEIMQFFSSLDTAITEAHRFGTKDFRPLQRDKAMFFTIYAAGLRASEALGLDIDSFRPNPTFPNFGDYGFISVWGKGSRGSGPRHRTVPVDHAGLPPLLKWYTEKVRPKFLLQADANEPALFLSERGNRLAISTLEARFQVAIGLADLGGKNLTPHCLRHSSVSHGAMAMMSVEAMRLKHGHAFAATTQGYTHVPDDFVNQEINRLVDRQLRDAIGDQNDRET
jgi:site-specific recombinase XerD